MRLEPVKKRSAAAAVFDQLFERLLAGDAAPGAALPAERALTETFQVNRQAVREALQRLAQAGMVQIQHGGSTRVLDYRRSASLDLLPKLFVRPDGDVDRAVARSVMEMRACIGPDVARLCAERAAGGLADELDACVDAIEAASADLVEAARLDLHFWDKLVDGSDNIAYRLAYNSLKRAYEPLIGSLHQVLAEELTDNASRRAIARAVRHGDAAAARAAATALLEKGSSTVTRLLVMDEEDE